MPQTATAPKMFVDEVRIALVSVEVLPALLQGRKPQGSDGIGFFLGTPRGYSRAFDDARERTGDLSPPWHTTDHSNFWSYYFGGRDYSDVSADQAMQLVTPLRYAIHAQPTAVSLSNLNVRLEAYCYPHAVGVVVGMRLAERLRLSAVVRHLADVRVVINAQSIPLRAVSGLVLRELRRHLTGAQTPGEPVSPDALRVVAIIKGDGFPKPFRIEEEGQLHRALEGICTGRMRVPSTELHSLQKKLVPAGRGADDRILYRSGRHLAICFPDKLQIKGRSRTVGCFHRNQVALALQVQSLQGFVRWAAHVLRSGREPHAAVVPLVRAAADAMTDLYIADGETYKSRAAATLIDASGGTSDLDLVRRQYGNTEKLSAEQLASG